MIAIPAVFGLPLAILAFFLPGLAFARDEEWARGEPVELAAAGCALSAAWWAVGIWVVGITRVPLSAFAILSLVAAAGILARRREPMARAVAAWRRERGHAAFAIAFMAFVLATRALFAFTRLGASVGDMSAHAYMTELIVMRDGLPATYAPFLPIGDFGSFPPGFHALAAVETLLAGVPTYRSTIHVMAFALAAMTFTLAALLRALGAGRVTSAASAAGALMLARNPQFFASWGGAPTLLAAALVFLVLRDALRLVDRCSWPFLARLGFLSAGTLLVHQLPVVSFVWVFAVAIALRARGDTHAWANVARNGAVVLAIAALLAVPFLTRTPLSIPPDVATWASGWIRGEAERALPLQQLVLGRLGAHSLAHRVGVHSWPFYVVVYLGIAPVLLLGAGLATRWARQRDDATTLATALVLVNAALFAGALGRTLPLWPSLYPSRTGIWLAPALAIALAGLLAWAVAHVPRRVLAVAGVLWLAAFGFEGNRLAGTRFGTAFYEAGKAGGTSPAAVVANEAAGGAFWVETFSRDNAVLTTDDLRAFQWVRDHTPANAAFATNYYDGGNLITAIAHRRVLEPHFNLDFYHRPQLDSLRRERPDYVYVSAEASPSGARRYTAEGLDRDAGVELVFRSGAARVYRVRSR